MVLAGGSQLGLYKILSLLGAGGMGEVYRATDTKLGRDVALKVFSAEMARDSERLLRFEREAKALAKLDHPNIVTIYSVEECDGVHFLTMQLVEGSTLDELIPQEGLPLDQLVEIAQALAEALAAAHEKNIIHRDLKPANVMVTKRGRVQVLDFGLAKDIRATNSNDTTMMWDEGTQVGRIMGTPPYMSPEQVSGRSLDHLTDIFSLGVMLHEMATGKRPFTGVSAAEVFSAILRDDPPSVTDLRAELPSELATVIRRCMEKNPSDRLQTARDVCEGLRDVRKRITSQARLPDRPSPDIAATADSSSRRTDEGFWIAVLPFKSAVPDADMRDLADCLSAEVVGGLSRFSYLRVIAHSSTQRYAGQSPDLRSVGTELGARYVLEGRLRRAGARLRVAVQVIDTSTGAQLWSETYERPFDANALFDLQDDLVPRIVSTVADAYGFLPSTMGREVRRKDPATLTPYEALLRSFCYAERVTAEEHAQAKIALERAVKQAPGFSDCWAMLSILLTDEYIHGFNPQPDSQSRGLQAARRAVDTDPANHKAYQALAWALCWMRQGEAARNAGDRALELNSMDSCAMIYVGEVFGWTGQWERGCELCLRAMDLNPNHPGWYRMTIWADAYNRKDFATALTHALKVSMPGFPLGYVALAATHGKLGDKLAGGEAVRELLAIRPDYPSVAVEELSHSCTPELAVELIDGLRKAGMVFPDDPPEQVVAQSSSVDSALEML